METQTIKRVRAQRTTGTAGVVAYAGAAAFAVGAAWFWLAAKRVTVAAAPRVGPHVSPQHGMRVYYRWQITTLFQERLYTSIAIAGFLCLAVSAVFLRDLLARDRTLARVGALAIGAGALLWTTGSVAQLGGHRAVGLMATHANPIQTTNSIAFTVDIVAAAFALAAFALVGAGMLALAAAAARERPRRRAWARYTALVALALLVLAGSYAAGSGDLTDLMLIADGVVLLPVWLIWSGHIGGTGCIGQAARTSVPT
jgi:hypothetical protein